MADDITILDSTSTTKTLKAKDVGSGVLLPLHGMADPSDPTRIAKVNADGSTNVVEGADITSPTAMPAGGVGLRGWVSAIWTKINGSIAVTVAALPAALGVGGGLKIDGSGTSLPVTATEQKTATANTPVIGTSNGDAIASNANRIEWSIQNLGTNTLYVLEGTGASATVFHYALPGGVANDDGFGESCGGRTYTGVISVYGTSPRYTTREL